MKRIVILLALLLNACGPRQLIKTVSCESADKSYSYQINFYPDDRNITACKVGTVSGQSTFNYDGDAVRYKQWCQAGGVVFTYEGTVGASSDGTALTCN